jgi:RNA polymerase sigma-70 factor (ECF subfamily)
LLDRAKARDPEAWRRLIDLYGPLIYHWCRQYQLSPEDRADIFQEVFQAVATHLPRFRKDRPGDTFRGWLLVITTNKVRDHFRKRGRQPQAAGGSDANRRLHDVPDSDTESTVSSAPAQEAGLFQRALELVRGDFAEATWQAFWRVAVEGQSPADVAADLKMSSVNAVYQAKARVLRRLREELGDLFE